MMAVGLFEGRLIIYIWDPTGFYIFTCLLKGNMYFQGFPYVNDRCD